MNKITTKTLEILLDKEGIIRIKILDKAQICLDDAIDNFLASKRISAGQKRLKLIDAKSSWIITNEARRSFLEVNAAETTIAKAVLVNDFIDLVIKAFKVRSSSGVPIKFFLFEESALKWLYQFKEKK